MAQPLRTLMRRAALPASWAYRCLIEARNARFDAGRGVRQLDRPVLSIGNITAGGTGKSPMVSWVTRVLRAAGHTPAIAMRGYGAAAGARNDEQLEYEWRQPDVLIAAHPDRFEALRALLVEHPEVDCIVLDDGFQHRQLHRYLDIVLIDGTAETFSEALLPAGRLREPWKSLRRADAVVVTRSDAPDSKLAAQIERYHGAEPIAWAQHRWSDLMVVEAGAPRTEPVQWLEGRRVLTMLGVGHPRSVEA
jgi:tetraacyldisaccharide 4'-kinase